MTREHDPDGATARVAMPDSLDLRSCERFHADLVELRGNVVLDASAVERVTSCGLQLLLAFRARQVDRGHAVSFADPSDAFVDCVTVLGSAVADLSAPPEPGSDWVSA